MIAEKGMGNSLTITRESMPDGALIAVTEEPGESGAKSSRPSSVAAARVALASNCAFSISFGMVKLFTYFRDSAKANSREVAGVQADSPLAAFFFSFFRLKYERGRPLDSPKAPALRLTL